MSDAMIGTMLSKTGCKLETREWIPEGAPVGVVQLVHGMAEHIARYDWIAKQLNAAGYVAVGHTQLGHGKMAETPGWFAKSDGWDALVEDVQRLREQTQQKYPGLPYFLLGHSMGSFIARTYCQKYEAGLAGVVLSGTGHFEPLILNVGLFLANVQCAFGGAKKPSKLLESISFMGYNSGWSPTRTAFDWLSKDTDVVDRYVADPLCGFPFTAGGYRDMFTGLKRLYPQNLAAMDKDVPILLFSGASDPVGARGAGVKTTVAELQNAGIKNVTFKLYENGRHEMLNETERETVSKDLIAWLAAQRKA